MLFALICTDKPDHLALRQSTREAHLAFLNGLGAALKAAGPFLDDDGKPSGSLVIIEAADLATAKTLAAGDPYAKEGLFESVDIRPWAWLIKNPEGAA